jgi:threonine-phosphate decarboxylase
MNISHGGAVFSIARERGWDWRDVLDFSANLNPLGPAPGVRDAIIDAVDRIVHYPDPHAQRVAAALGELWNIEPDRILVGNGATDLIHFLARMWPQAETTLVVPTYSEFHRAYPDAAWAPAESPASWPDEGLLILTRPNNPLGLDMYVPGGRSGPVLIDESFIDFTELNSTMPLGDVVLRSLTKIYALPGLRVGAIAGPGDLIRKWRDLREPWQLNVLAEAAVLASLADTDYVVRTRHYLEAERPRLLECVAEIPGVTAVHGLANFLFARLGYSAQILCDFMLEQKVLLRNCAGWIGTEGEAVRFAIRTPAENDRLIALWRAFACEQ